jgi:hypothetical protein
MDVDRGSGAERRKKVRNTTFHYKSICNILSSIGNARSKSSQNVRRAKSAGIPREGQTAGLDELERRRLEW